MLKSNWPKSDRIAAASLIIAIISTLAAIFVVPEFRYFIGLDRLQHNSAEQFPSQEERSKGEDFTKEATSRKISPENEKLNIGSTKTQAEGITETEQRSLATENSKGQNNSEEQLRESPDLRDREIASFPMPTWVLRSEPTILSGFAVDNMLKQYNFFCAQYNFNETWNNPNGEGIPNNYVLEQDSKVVVDRVTGLMWQRSFSPNYMNFSTANEYIHILNNTNFAGFRDWRLPTLEEAMSLIEPIKQRNLHIDSVFIQTQELLWIWTADVGDDGSPPMRWIVYFHNGSCNKIRFNSNYSRFPFVLAVRRVH